MPLPGYYSSRQPHVRYPVKSVKEKLKAAKEASTHLTNYSEFQRQDALHAIASAVISQEKIILEENSKDLQRGKHLSQALQDRLTFSPKRLHDLAFAVMQIAYQPAVLGKTTETHTRPDGLKISQERIPLGVIGIIFESRPNVVVDCAALAIKSGNAVVLKGGKEASFTNRILGEIIRSAISEIIPQECVQILDSEERSSVATLLSSPEFVDMIVPRGGQGLIDYVRLHSRVPVIAHAKGLCHIYVHQDADLAKSHAIAMNAKIQRPGVCNAMETLLVHENIADDFLKKLIPDLKKNNVEIRGCSWTKKNFPKDVIKARDIDWDTEYLDRILSVRVVHNIDEAIQHIQKHGSHHTEGICTNSQTMVEKFKNALDASCIVVNASTRFNDGGELGLGAELGISTTKFHAYGPMGAEQMTIPRFVVVGNGHCRS